ncbi:KR-domain-containing protein [Xylaria sp. FL0064]|nr:KR-domain-containing protein [Xylaria sp. FL0064]
MEGRFLYRYYADALRMGSSLVPLASPLRTVIGGGTGGATRHMLRALGGPEQGGPHAASWHFTDISSRFFEAARSEFAEWSEILDFDRLDIEKDPASQGFPLENYDIVVACEVLHATKSMARTMAHVRSLVRPGGTLLLIETTQDQVNIQFTFGLLAGWWLSEEPERQSSPSLTLPFADHVLKRAGFTGAEFDVPNCDRSPPQKLQNSNQLVLVISSKAPPSPGTVEMIKNSIMATTHFALSALVALDSTIETVRVSCVTTGDAIECENPDASLIQGLLRTIQNEYMDRLYITLDLQGSLTSYGNWQMSSVEAIARITHLGFGAGTAADGSIDGATPEDFEWAEGYGVLPIPRLYKDVTRNSMIAPPRALNWHDPDGVLKVEPIFQEQRSLRLQVGILGLLDTLPFSDDDMVEIEPRAYGLNFRDVMRSDIITRGSSEAREQGFEIGDRVMALLLGPFATDMSFDDATSLPMVFSIAYVALVDVARLQKGQSVLIYAAARGVGQAAIMFAKYLGAGNIYVTVDSQKKREPLAREYGLLRNIFSNRSISFASDVLEATVGCGVDVVLSSLSGHLLQASFEILAPFGHLVEIGKKDLEGNSLLDMGTFSRVSSYSSLDMMTLLRQRGKHTHGVLSEVARLVRERVLKPVHPVTVWPMGDAAKAFRLSQTGKHAGKIVLSAKPNEEVKERPRQATPSVRLKPNSSYLLVGGTGGLGRSIAHWTVERARNLILLSRSASNEEESGEFVAELRETGCRVVAVSCDVSITGHLAQALRTCKDQGLPPVRGVIQGAMRCIVPKVCGTRNLHVQYSTSEALDFSIMLSSFSRHLGLVSQANYAAGSAYQDALARQRSAHGLPGVAIDLGAVRGVGETAVHSALQAVIAHPVGHPQILLGLNTVPGLQWDPQGKSQMARDARFLALKWRGTRAGSRIDANDGTQGQTHTLAHTIASAQSSEAAAKVIGQTIAAKLAAIFMLPADDID